MPLREFIYEHHNKQHKDVLFNCMVAAKVSKKDMHASPDAMKAMNDEWSKLDERLVFDWDSVMEFHKAVPEAQAYKRKTGKDNHFGSVF